MEKDPENYHNVVTTMDTVHDIVRAVLLKHLPKEYAHLSVFCEMLPMNQCPPTFPFPGFVLNIQVCTQAHTDTNDDLLCIVIPFGDCQGGELVLHEAGLVLELKEGDILIFPSSKLTHYNLHFQGVRGSYVMHSDKEVRSWTDDLNGWGNKISQGEAVAVATE